MTISLKIIIPIIILLQIHFHYIPLEAPSLSVLGASGAGIKDFLTINFLHRSGMGFSWGDPSLRFSLGYFPIPFVESNLL